MPCTFEANTFLLTYAQDAFNINTDFDTAKTFFQQLGLLQYLAIGVEQHQSGDPHWHAVVYYKKRLRLGPRGFDFRDKHPNVKVVGQRVIDWTRCIDYVTKDGITKDYGTPRHTSQSVWRQVLSAETREAATKILQEGATRDFVLNRRNLDYSLDQMYPLQAHSSFQPRPSSSFCIPDDLVRWMSGNLEYENKNKVN